MKIELEDRVALVAGAAQGIGRSLAEHLRAAGAQVHLADLDEKALKATANELDLPYHVLDLSSRTAAHSLVAEIAEETHQLDILVNATGGVRGQVGRPLEEIEESDWRVIFQANLDAAFWLCQAAAPVMKRGLWGRIVNIASGAGLRPSLTGIQAYTAAKHGLVGLTRQLSWELAPHGITVNAVAPGVVLSNPATIRQWESYGPEGQDALLKSIHTRRLGRPDDIATAALFLVSEQAAWISGEVLGVNGGRS